MAPKKSSKPKAIPRFWGLVLSRKNSKRLPGKATKMLAGQPMVTYTFEAARHSNALDATWLFTDDEAVIELAKDYDVQTPKFPRPEALSEDGTSSEETIRYFLDTLLPKTPKSIQPDYLVLLQATSPLRTSADIDLAIARFLESGTSSLISTCKPQKPAKWLKRQDSGTNAITPFEAPDDLMLPNGAIYIVDVASLRNGNPLVTEPCLGYEMPWERSVDVDTAEDFMLAELLLQRENPVQYIAGTSKTHAARLSKHSEESTKANSKTKRSSV